MDKLNTNEKYQELIHPGTTLASEIKQIFGLPEYADDADWYDRTCVAQTGFMSVRRLTDDIEELTKLRSFIASFRDVKSFSHVQLFVTRPNYKGAWHLDGINTKAAINIPLFGCEKSCIEWTKHNFTAKTITSLRTNYRTPEEYASASVTADLKLTLTSMALVKTDSWHRINNLYNKVHRVTASIRFNDEPEFSTLRQEMKAHWKTTQ